MSYDLIENTNVFLDRLDTSLRDLQEAFAPLKSGPSDFYFQKIKEWLGAFFETAPMKVGDKIQLIRVPHIPESSGWWHYRDTFKVGAVATVTQLDCRDGEYWLNVRWEEQYQRLRDYSLSLVPRSYSEFEFEKVSQVKPNERGIFVLPASFFVPHNPGYIKWVPWAGTKEQKEGQPRSSVWEDQVVPLLGPGSEVKKKHTHKEKKFLGWIITNPVVEK